MVNRRIVLAAFLATTLWAAPAFAQGIGEMSSFNRLATATISWIQGIALIIATGYLIRAGLIYSKGNHGGEGSEGVKSAAIGTAIIAGAVVIMQFIKVQLGA